MPLFSLRAARIALTAATLAAVLLAGAAAARAAAPYRNPFTGEQPYVGRTDMGVDLCLSPGDSIYALHRTSDSLSPGAGLAVFAGGVAVLLAAAAYRLKRTDV